jgi:2,4-diaminopentanoate dehydrogenase
MGHRVIHWATGHTGQMVIRATADRRPEYEIVGGFTYNPTKSGKDLGEICGIEKLGVIATNDRQKIIDTPADCVLFLAGAENDVPGSIKDICALLESGKNVVSTAANFIYLKSLGPGVENAVAAACKKGGSTFHGLGIMPGFFSDALPLMLSSLARRVDCVTASETLAYDKYPSTYQMFDLMGFGYTPDDPTPAFANVEMVGETWRHSGMLMADLLGLPIDRVEPFRNVITTDRDLHVASGLIPKGTVGAMNFGVRVVSGGKVKIVLQHFTRMSDHLAPEWPSGHGWIIELDGEPSIRARVEIGTHGSIMPTDDACMATALYAIHAVPYVVAAKPGIYSLADMPLISGTDAFHIKR